MSMNDTLPTRGMLLAAGKGTRLRPLTNEVPKCMVPVAGKPLLEWNIEWLGQYGIKNLIINLHHRPEAVIDYFADGSSWGVDITYSVEDTLLGTAGGVKNVEWFFEGPFLLWYGDNLCTCDIAGLYDLHRRNQAVATLALFRREDPTSSGIVGVNQGGRITRFLEKPQPEQVFSNWVNAGVSVLDKSVFDFIPVQGAPDFGHDVLPALLEQGFPLYGYRMSGSEGLWWIDTPRDLARVRDEFERRKRVP